MSMCYRCYSRREVLNPQSFKNIPELTVNVHSWPDFPMPYVPGSITMESVGSTIDDEYVTVLAVQSGGYVGE